MRKKYHKKKKQQTFLRKLLIIISPLFLIVLFVGGWLVWYQSLTLPEVGSEVQITTLPVEFSHVLGAKTGPNVKELSLRIPIFLYHYVEPPPQNDPGRQNLNIPPNILQAQIETLKNAGYTFLTAQELSLAMQRKIEIPKKVVMLTFDDGYSDFYNYVLPILQKENVRATFYIVPDFLDRPNYLSTQQLEALAKNPLAEIAAHTMDHAWLAGQSTQVISYQVIQSRKFLQNLLGLPINSFAYPYGAFDDKAVSIVKQAGFTNALSTVPGIIQTPENVFYLFRLRPGYRTGQTLLTFLDQDSFKAW